MIGDDALWVFLDRFLGVLDGRSNEMNRDSLKTQDQTATFWMPVNKE